MERTTGDYAGIGLLVDARNGWVTVVTPMADSPAERAGIRTGDQLYEVDGLSAADWSLDQAVQAMRGTLGSPVEIAIRREGAAEPVRFRLLRERIHQRAVPAGMLLPSGVGYLSMTMVRENAAEELEHEVTRLVGQGMRVLLLDLRSNPGGLRDEAVEAADLFLDPGQEILVSRGRAPGDNHRWSDDRAQRWPELPVVVMVSAGTASAAEIIAGALQDHDRALIVGDTTYGKGIVQTVFTLAPDLALRMTTARWYTPAGRSIQGAALDSVMGAAGRAAPGARLVHGGPQADRRQRAGARRRAGGGHAHRGGSPSSRSRWAGRSPVFRDVLAGYAFELKKGPEVGGEQFAVTRRCGMRSVAGCSSRGIAIADSVYTGGTGSWMNSWATRSPATPSDRRRSDGGGRRTMGRSSRRSSWREAPPRLRRYSG